MVLGAVPIASAEGGVSVSELARVLLEELVTDPVALERLRELVGDCSPTEMPAAAAVVTVPALLSVAHVATLLDVSPHTVRRRIADGSLPSVLDHGA